MKIDKDQQNLAAMQSLLQPAMASGAGLIDAAEILTNDNLSEIKDKLKEIELDRAEREQAMQQQQQALAEQQLQVQMQQQSEENRIKEEDSIRKAETQLQVALIGQEGNEGEDNGTEELEKLRLQKEKINKDFELKQRQINEDIRKNRVAEQQKSEEINIKRKQANKPNKIK